MGLCQECPPAALYPFLGHYSILYSVSLRVPSLLAEHHLCTLQPPFSLQLLQSDSDLPPHYRMWIGDQEASLALFY